MDRVTVERVAEILLTQGVYLYTARGRSRREVLEDALDRFGAVRGEGQATFAYAFFLPATKTSGPVNRIEVHGERPDDAAPAMQLIIEAFRVEDILFVKRGRDLHEIPSAAG